MNEAVGRARAVSSEADSTTRAADAILAGALASMRCRSCYRSGRPRDAMSQLRILHEALLELTGMQLSDEHARSTQALRKMARRHAAVLQTRLAHPYATPAVACRSAPVRRRDAW